MRFICCMICILGCCGVDLFLFSRSLVLDAVGDFLLIENEGRIFFIGFMIVDGSFMWRFRVLINGASLTFLAHMVLVPRDAFWLLQLHNRFFRTLNMLVGNREPYFFILLSLPMRFVWNNSCCTEWINGFLYFSNDALCCK